MKTVAIVGRPNVGKSRLFNRLIGRRHSIVDGTPGITRDRVECVVERGGRSLRWIDTGGIGSSDPLADRIVLQANVAISAADAVVLVVDARDGLVPLDREIADRLRRKGRVIVAANKIDDVQSESAAAEFSALGFDTVVPISAEHGLGADDLWDRIEEMLGPDDAAAEEAPVTRVAIVGRPNTGKSTLLNALVGSERAIVSPAPGTTRDAIEAVIELPRGRIALVDTAGIRKRRRDFSLLESIMVARTRDAVRSSDVAIVLTDAVEGLTDQDQKILSAVFENGKGAVLALNKWDLVEQKEFDKRVRSIRSRLGSFAHVPIVSISALKKQRVQRLLEAALAVGANATFQMRTASLNRILADVSRAAPSGMRIKYAIQKSILPPSFILFGLHKPARSLLNAVHNALRRDGRFDGVPLMIEVRR